MANDRNAKNSRNDRNDRATDKDGRKRRKKICKFCSKKIDNIDYKEVDFLNRYLSDKGKIVPARSTGTCAKHQRKLTSAIKRARNIALLPYLIKE